MASHSLCGGLLMQFKLQEQQPKQQKRENSFLFKNKFQNGYKSNSLDTTNNTVSTNNNRTLFTNDPSLSLRFACNSSSSVTAETAGVSPEEAMGFGEIKEKCKKWTWKDQFAINYLVSHQEDSSSSNPPLLLVHGFGASIPHWRRYFFFIRFWFILEFLYVTLWPLILVYHTIHYLF